MSQPFLVVVDSYYTYKNQNSKLRLFEFHQLFTEVKLYTTLVIGYPLYGVVVAYLFTVGVNSWNMQTTLKNLLNIPVSRRLVLL